ncbi:uncharacterized protein LOC134226585 [Armigeres subalbatus]|uniref:uncharacterized protein LOC134226585 n=1 Tax=Armigeres subalbatus TaxID=124917 RepID=UPI002ED176BB
MCCIFQGVFKIFSDAFRCCCDCTKKIVCCCCSCALQSLCCIIFVVLIIALAIGLGIYFGIFHNSDEPAGNTTTTTITPSKLLATLLPQLDDSNPANFE